MSTIRSIKHYRPDARCARCQRYIAVHKNGKLYAHVAFPGAGWCKGEARNVD